MIRLLSICSALFLLTACRQQVSFDKLPKTNAALAWSYAEKSVSFKERFSGSDSISRYADWIQKTASKYPEVKVSQQCFTEQTPNGAITFRNIIAEFPGEKKEWVLIGSHYDAKRFLTIPDFQAANDGASSTAALLAMIDALHKYQSKPPFTIRFVFFDGEECAFNYTSNDGLHGSRAAAAQWKKNGDLKKCRAMILLDMIGDRDLNLTLPANTSRNLSASLKKIIRSSMPELRYSQLPYAMTDDHVPFQRQGIPAIDLIDFEYGPGNSFWHTSGDTLENISGKSIKQIADLALALLWEL